MAEQGTRANNLDPIAKVDALVGNRSIDGVNKVGKISVDNLALQLATSTPLSALLAAGAFRPYTSRADLYADLDPVNKTIAWVVGDADPAKDGIYRKNGATGTGAWVYFAPLPYESSDSAALADLPTFIEAASPLARPGEPGDYYGTDQYGAPATIATNTARAAAAPVGKVAVINNAGVIAPKVPYRVEPGRKYRLRFVARRSTDTLDPANDAVRLGMVWLTATYDTVATRTLVDLLDLTESDGRVQRIFDFPSADIERPEGSVYLRPFVRAFGTGGVTQVEVIEFSDMTDTIELVPEDPNDVDGRFAEVPTFIEAASPLSRPGEPGKFYGTEQYGAPVDIESVVGKATSPLGRVAAIAGAGIVAPKVPYRIEPGRQYRLRVVLRRSVDTPDPANDTIRIGMVWMTSSYELVSTVTLVDLAAVTVASGRLQRTYDFPSDGIPKPASAVYMRPFVRAFGASGMTQVEVMAFSDMTDVVEWSPDLEAFEDQLAGMQQEIDAIKALDDITDLEDAAPASLDGVYIAGQIEGETDAKKYLLSDIQAIFAARLPWDGATRFVHGPGLNMGTPLGFWRYSIQNPDLAWETPSELLASWQNYYLPRRPSHIEAKADVIRIAIDPHKMLLTDCSDAVLAPWVTAYKKVVDSVVNGDDGGSFKAILDMHIAAGSDADPATSDAGIMASYDGDKVLWNKFKAVLRALMKMMNVAFRSDQVAFEIYNETERPLGDATYQAAIVEAANDLHRLYGDRIKVIVAPEFFASHRSFTAATAFRRDLFHAQHIGFALHGGYYPNVFTHQGIGLNIMRYIHRLPFYPTSGAKAAYIAAAVAEATADGASSGDISTLTTELNLYFDSFQVGTDFDGVSTIPTAYPIGYIWGNYQGTDEGGHILAWMNENGVSGDMMHCTEIGVHRDYEGIGAAVDDAATFFRLIRTYAVDARGMNGLVAWCEEDRHFSLRSDVNGGVGEYDPSGPFEKKIIRALGMYSPFSTDELGDRFVYFGVNNTAIEALSASEERRGIFVKIQATVANSIRTIFGASENGGAQFTLAEDRALTVERQGIARQAGTNVAMPVNKPVVVGVVMDPDDVYRFAIGRPLSGGLEQYDSEFKDAFTAGTTMVVGETIEGAQPFIGAILSPYLITDGVITDVEIGQIVEWLDTTY